MDFNRQLQWGRRLLDSPNPKLYFFRKNHDHFQNFELSLPQIAFLRVLCVGTRFSSVPDPFLMFPASGNSSERWFGCENLVVVGNWPPWCSNRPYSWFSGFFQNVGPDPIFLYHVEWFYRSRKRFGCSLRCVWEICRTDFRYFCSTQSYKLEIAGRSHENAQSPSLYTYSTVWSPDFMASASNSELVTLCWINLSKICSEDLPNAS